MFFVNAQSLGYLSVGLVEDAASGKNLSGMVGQRRERFLEYISYFGRHHLMGIACLQGDPRNLEKTLVVIQYILLDRASLLKISYVIEAFVLDGGQDIGRGIGYLAVDPIPVLPPMRETLHHDIFRYGNISQVAVSKSHESEMIFIEYPREFGYIASGYSHQAHFN